MHAIGVVLLSALLVAACAPTLPQEPMRLDGGLLTVDNQSTDEWLNVEIWVNNYYRALVPSIAAHARFQTQLDTFVSGYGQRFNFRRAQITDLRLNARRRNGEAVELKKDFQGTPLDEALRGKR